MIGYCDMTFCAAEDCAKWKICERALTKEVIKGAEEWWGGKGAPISVAKKFECYKRGDI